MTRRAEKVERTRPVTVPDRRIPTIIITTTTAAGTAMNGRDRDLIIVITAQESDLKFSSLPLLATKRAEDATRFSANGHGFKSDK